MKRVVIKRQCFIGSHALVSYLQLEEGDAGGQALDKMLQKVYAGSAREHLHAADPVVAEKELLEFG